MHRQKPGPTAGEGAIVDPAQRGDVIAVKAEPVGELEPARDAAVAFPLAVVIDQARTPFAAHGRILAACDQARILDRDHRLIVVAVERPSLHLTLAALAAVQKCVKRVQAMIAAGADIAQCGFQFLRRQQLHSTISIPSSATCQPAASTAERSGEPAMWIGLVLLM